MDTIEGRIETQKKRLLYLDVFADWLETKALPEGRLPYHPWAPFLQDLRPLLNEIRSASTQVELDIAVRQLRQLIEKYDLEETFHTELVRRFPRLEPLLEMIKPSQLGAKGLPAFGFFGPGMLFGDVGGDVGAEPGDVSYEEEAPPEEEAPAEEEAPSDHEKSTAEPAARYADFAFYKETRSKVRADEPVQRGYTLKEDQWYQFEVAIREKPLDYIPVTGERRPIREPKQKKDVTLYVAIEGAGFEIEEPVQTIILPPKGDSKENAYFRVRPEKETASVKERATLRVRIYYEFNLLEVAIIEAEVVGKFEDDTRSQFDLEAPITFHHARIEGDYVDFDDVQPREMHIDITREDTTYLFHFIFYNEADEKVEFTQVPARLTEADLESDLVALRRALWNITMSAPYGDQLTGVEAEFAEQMNNLARFGRKLWIKLFKRERGSALWEVGAWLEEHPLKDDGIVQISVEKGADTFVFPWGLLYDRAYPQDRDELPQLDGFWGLRYVIEQRLPVGRRWNDSFIELQNGFEMGFMLWPFAQATLQENLIKDLTTRGHGSIAGGKPITAANSSYDLLADCQSHILYFYTHGHTRAREADIGSLDFLKMYEQLPQESPLREQWKDLYTEAKQPDFEAASSWIGLRYGKLYLDDLYARDVNLHSEPIVVLNMCESAQATPSLSDSFVHLFIDRGARCVVGTECPMRPLFAHHFSEAFLEALLSGDSVGQALLDARRTFIACNNPLGLAYTLFGSATAGFKKPPPLS